MAKNQEILWPGEQLLSGEFLISNNGLFYAVMQEDGNFVIYRGDSFQSKLPGYEKTVLWSRYDLENAPGSIAGGYRLKMETSGDLMIYPVNTREWAFAAGLNNPGKEENSLAIIAPDGNFYVTPSHKGLYEEKVWATGCRDTMYKVRFDEVVYDLESAKITQIGQTVERLSTMICVDPTITLPQENQLVVSTTITDKRTFSSTTGLKLTASTTVTAGVPGVESGSVTLSVEASQAITFGKEEDKSTTEEIAISVKTSPGECIKARASWTNSEIILNYKCNGIVNFEGLPDIDVPIHIDGVYTGVASHDLSTDYVRVDKQGNKLPT